jgi:two-component system, cell cycle response regulator
MARKYQTTVESGHTILVIDDSYDFRETTRGALEAEGHRVLVAEDGRSGVEMARSDRPHLIIADSVMAGMSGEDVVRAVREFDRNVQIILATGYADQKPPRVMMQRLDIQGFHDKSEGADRLMLWVDSSLKAYKHLMAMEKHRIGLQYILDIAPDLHRLQPLDELLHGILWQLEGLMGAENSFLATFSSERISRSGSDADPDGMVTLLDGRKDSRGTRDEGALAIRVGTGRFRSGIPTETLPEPERLAVEKAVSERQISFHGGISVVPLKLGDQMLGVIYMDRRPAMPRDAELLEIFAAQAAGAIQSALMYGQNALLLDLATRDPITGAYLRGYAMQQFHQHLKRSHRTGLPISVLMIDLDRLQEINERHGHVAGDEALRAIGEMVRDTVRETDCVARFGGDEFLIVLPDTDGEGATMVGDRLLERVRALAVRGGSGRIPVRVSIGGATIVPLVGESGTAHFQPEVIQRAAMELVSFADQSLFTVKHSGRVGEIRVARWSVISASTAAA